MYKDKNELSAIFNLFPDSLIRHIYQSKLIADIGFGNGSLLKYLSDTFRIDSRKLIGFEKNHHRNRAGIPADCRIYSADFINSFSYPKKSIHHSCDTVFLLDVIEHIKKPRIFLNNIGKLMNKKSSLVLTTPNAGSLTARLLGRRWSGYSDPSHFRLYSLKKLADLLIRSGYSIHFHTTHSQTKYNLYSKFAQKFNVGSQLILWVKKTQNHLD